MALPSSSSTSSSTTGTANVRCLSVVERHGFDSGHVLRDNCTDDYHDYDHDDGDRNDDNGFYLFQLRLAPTKTTTMAIRLTVRVDQVLEPIWAASTS